MDSTLPASLLTFAPGGQRGWIAMALGLLGRATVLGWQMNAYAGGSDSSGYLNSARLLRDGKIRVLRRTLPDAPPAALTPYVYIPIGFTPIGDDQMSPTYPSGLPLLVVALSFLTGWDAAPHVTMAAHALAGIVLTYMLARHAGLSPAWSYLAGLLLASSPLYLFSSVQLMSDVPALVWTTAAVLLAWHSRTQPWLGLVAGAVTAMAVLVRPTNALVVAPLAALFALYNHAAYGGALTTGYGPIWQDFNHALAGPTVLTYARWLPVVFTPVILFALVLPLAAGIGGAWRKPLLAWAGVFAGFYLFLLPAVPPLLVAALLVIARWADRPAFAPLQRHRAIAFGLLAAAILVWGTKAAGKLSAFGGGRGEQHYIVAADWARSHLPADALIFATQTSGALYCYTGFTFARSELMSAADVAAVERAAARESRPVFAMLFPFEVEPVLSKLVPGNWTKIGAVHEVTFWRRDRDASQ